MDVASEPHESNIYLVSNISELSQDFSNQLSNVLCNSKHFTAMRYVLESSILNNKKTTMIYNPSTILYTLQ